MPDPNKRPLGVSIIALLLCLFGAELTFAGFSGLLGHGIVLPVRHTAFLRTMGLVNPYVALIAGAMWIWIAWGLLKLNGLARLAAMLLIIVGVGFEFGRLFVAEPGMRGFPWWTVLSIFIRLAVVGYLFLPSVMDRFLQSARRA